MLKNIGSVVLLVCIAMGVKLYNKSNQSAQYRQELIRVCGDNKDCKTAVEENFVSCYDEHYSLGSKRRAGKLNLVEFTKCMNEESDQEYFRLSTNV